jgi:uncharacterized protein
MYCEGCSLFTARDSEVYRRLHAASRTEISDSCLISRVAWNKGFNYQKLFFDDCLCLISDGGVFTSPHMTWPVGSLEGFELKSLMDQAWRVFQQNGWPFRLMYIDELYLPLLENLPGYQVKITYKRDFDDYVYDAEELRQLSGKTLHGQRNYFNRFTRSYPDYEYRQLTAADRDEALNLVRSWCIEKSLDCQNLCQSDYLAIKQAFDDFPVLDIRGGAIRVAGRMVAFAFGSLLRGETAVIHFEKAASGYDGLYAAINKFILDYTFPDVRFVNREEDMGIAGLRKAKEAYCPVRMIHKYEAILNRVGG